MCICTLVMISWDIMNIAFSHVRSRSGKMVLSGSESLEESAGGTLQLEQLGVPGMEELSAKQRFDKHCSFDTNGTPYTHTRA